MRPVAAAALLALWAILVGLLISPVLGDMGGDSAQYLALAEALARGEGYVDTHLPGTPQHVHYPPGMALLFAPLVWLFGPYPFVAAKVVVLALGVIGLFCFARLFTRLSGGQNALLAIGLSAFSPYFVRFGHTLLSEIPAMAMLGATLLALDRCRVGEGSARAHRYAWLAALFGAFSFLFRVAGIAAVAVVVVTLCVRFRRRAWARVALCVIPVVAFFAYAKSFQGGTWNYSDEIAARIGGPLDLVGHAFAGLPVFVRGLGTSIVETSFVVRSDVLSYVLATPILVGLAVSLKGRRAASAWCCILGVGIACAAPERTMRYLVPLAPLAAFFFVVGCRTVFAACAERIGALRLHEARIARSALAAGVLLALVQLPSIVEEVDRRYASQRIEAPLGMRDRVAPVDPGAWSELRLREPGGSIGLRYAAFLQLLELARTATIESDVLMSRKPRLVSYLTGRRCVRLPTGAHAFRRAKDLRARLDAIGHDVFVDDGLFRETMDAVRVIGTDGRRPYQVLASVRRARLMKRPASSEAAPHGR